MSDGKIILITGAGGGIGACLARRLAHKYARLVSLLFAETNPAPLKYAMELLGLCKSELRLPLAEIGDELKERIRAEMTALSML